LSACSFTSRLAGRLKDRHQFPLEVIMAQAFHPQPSKQMIRAYLERRASDPKPPPTPEEIRRQLGWGLLALDQKMSSGRS
jgi:hypothetical protein